MARIYRDAYGVPHIRATDVLDLARGQGYAAARDRAWQLEYQRRRATGTAAEVLGAPQLPWDTWARQTRIVDTARRAFDGLGEETRALRRGVRRGRERRAATSDAPELDPARRSSPRPGSRGRRWPSSTPSTCSSRACPASSGTTARGRCSAPTRRCCPATRRTAPGSNAWAVGGARTASGRPLIGGDPHRIFESPGVYAQVRLATRRPQRRASTSSASPSRACPGVQHFAHAGEVAWAITNAVRRLPGRLRGVPGRRRRRPRGDHRGARRRPGDRRGAGDRARAAVRGRPRPRPRARASATRRPCSATSASRRCSHCCARGPSTTSTARSTPGSRRSTTWSSPTAAARSGSATPAGCRCAPRPTGAASSPGAGGDTWSGWVALPRHDVAARRPGGHGQRATGHRERAAGQRVRPAAPGGPDPRAAARPRRPDRRPTSRRILGDSLAITALPLCAMVRDLDARAGGGAGPRRDPGVGRRDGGRLPRRRGVRRLAHRARHAGCAPSRCSPRCATTRSYGPLFAPYLSTWRPASGGPSSR